MTVIRRGSRNSLIDKKETVLLLKGGSGYMKQGWQG
jgi:hypothetical protein